MYLSLTEYLVVDQSLREMMISLGFEERTVARYIISKAWQVLESGLKWPLRHESLAASISAGSSHFVGHGPVLTAPHAWSLPIEHHALNSPCSTASCWHASCLPALHAGVSVSSGEVDSMADLGVAHRCTIV